MASKTLQFIVVDSTTKKLIRVCHVILHSTDSAAAEDAIFKNLRSLYPTSSVVAFYEIGGLNIKRQTLNSLKSFAVPDKQEWVEWVMDDCLPYELGGAYQGASSEYFQLAVLLSTPPPPSAAEPLTSIAEASEVPAKVSRRLEPLDRDGWASTIQKTGMSPSSGAAYSDMLKTQVPTNAAAIYDCGTDAMNGPYVGIYHPAFVELEHSLSRSPPTEFQDEDINMAMQLMSACRRFWTTELEFQQAMSAPLEHFLGGAPAPTKLLCGKHVIEPDAHRRGTVKGLPATAIPPCLHVTEIKRSEGEGKNATLQAFRCVATIYSQPALKPLRDISCMPCLVIGISSQRIIVSGTILLDRVVARELGSISMSLRGLAPDTARSEGDTLLKSLLHFLCCVKKCIEKLDAYFTGISLESPPSFDPHFRLPDLEYGKRISDSLSMRPVYEGVLKGTPCIIKFTTSYCREAHSIMHTNRAAPKLLHCQYHETVGRWCVVTEKVVSVESEVAGSLSTDGCNALKKALSELHAKGYVHGDLRGPNILVSDDHAWVIDYDWAGRAGEVTYPMDINMDPKVGWVGGIGPHRHILCEHDVKMLSKYLETLGN